MVSALASRRQDTARHSRVKEAGASQSSIRRMSSSRLPKMLYQSTTRMHVSTYHLYQYYVFTSIVHHHVTCSKQRLAPTSKHHAAVPQVGYKSGKVLQRCILKPRKDLCATAVLCAFRTRAAYNITLRYQGGEGRDAKRRILMRGCMDEHSSDGMPWASCSGVPLRGCHARLCGVHAHFRRNERRGGWRCLEEQVKFP